MDRSSEILTGKAEKVKFEIGQGRAPNTIRLRNEYEKYRIDAETGEPGGNEKEGKSEPVLPFREWAKKNYPDVKILE